MTSEPGEPMRIVLEEVEKGSTWVSPLPRRKKMDVFVESQPFPYEKDLKLEPEQPGLFLVVLGFSGRWFWEELDRILPCPHWSALGVETSE